MARLRRLLAMGLGALSVGSCGPPPCELLLHDDMPELVGVEPRPVGEPHADYGRLLPFRSYFRVEAVGSARHCVTVRYRCGEPMDPIRQCRLRGDERRKVELLTPSESGGGLEPLRDYELTRSLQADTTGFVRLHQLSPALRPAAERFVAALRTRCLDLTDVAFRDHGVRRVISVQELVTDEAPEHAAGRWAWNSRLWLVAEGPEDGATLRWLHVETGIVPLCPQRGCEGASRWFEFEPGPQAPSPALYRLLPSPEHEDARRVLVAALARAAQPPAPLAAVAETHYLEGRAEPRLGGVLWVFHASAEREYDWLKKESLPFSFPVSSLMTADGVNIRFEHSRSGRSYLGTLRIRPHSLPDAEGWSDVTFALELALGDGRGRSTRLKCDYRATILREGDRYGTLGLSATHCAEPEPYGSPSSLMWLALPRQIDARRAQTIDGYWIAITPDSKSMQRINEDLKLFAR